MTRTSASTKKVAANLLLNTFPCLAVCLVLLACALPSQAEQAQPTQSQTIGRDSTSVCTYNFTTGAGSKLLQFCVTVNGNVVQIQTPAGQEFINKGSVGEGYGVCTESPAQAYYDYADPGDSGNWNPPVLLSHNSTSVKIARTTSDGVYTLTQTFTLDKATPAVRVSMALKNNTAVARKVYLVRYADIDAGANWSTNNADGTASSAFGWSSTTGVGDGWGLVLQNTGTPWAYVNGFPQNTYLPPNPCAFAFNWPGHIVVNTDISVDLAYVDTIGAGSTKTASMMYRGM